MIWKRQYQDNEPGNLGKERQADATDAATKLSRIGRNAYRAESRRASRAGRIIVSFRAYLMMRRPNVITHDHHELAGSLAQMSDKPKDFPPAETLEDAVTRVLDIFSRSDTDRWRNSVESGMEIEYRITIKAGSGGGYRASMSAQLKRPRMTITTLNHLT